MQDLKKGSIHIFAEKYFSKCSDRICYFCVISFVVVFSSGTGAFVRFSHPIYSDKTFSLSLPLLLTQFQSETSAELLDTRPSLREATPLQ